MEISRGIPTVILSAATATQEELNEREDWVAQTAYGKHIQVPDSGHWLHLEQPEIVVGAVSDILGLFTGRALGIKPLGVLPAEGQ
jgi:pimeloyl-ACP methyl ester carboxylesterase